jgi:hypothetical protein
MSEPAAADRGTIDSSAATGPAAAAASSTGPPAAPGAAAQRVRRHDPVPLTATVVITVLGGLVLAAMNGSYLGLTVTTGVAYAVVTVGMVLQLGYSRQLAFSQSVFMGVGAYGTGVLETKYGFNSLESLLAVIALATVASLLMGAVVTRAPGLALALATLLLPLFVYQLAADSGWLGSFSGIDGVLPFWNGPDYESTLVRSGIISVLLLGLAAGLMLRVMRSGVGLQLMAMASDERLGESIGVSLRQRRLEVFVLGSVLAAVGGGGPRQRPGPGHARRAQRDRRDHAAPDVVRGRAQKRRRRDPRGHRHRVPDHEYVVHQHEHRHHRGNRLADHPPRGARRGSGGGGPAPGPKDGPLGRVPPVMERRTVPAGRRRKRCQKRRLRQPRPAVQGRRRVRSALP